MLHIYPLLTLLIVVSIVLLPHSTVFYPMASLLPLKLYHRKSTRLGQVMITWGLAADALIMVI